MPAKTVNDILNFIPSQLEGEDDEAYNAFVRYCLLGTNRSVQKVAEHIRLNDTESTQERVNTPKYKRYSSSYNWTARAAIFDNRMNHDRNEFMVIELLKDRDELARKVEITNRITSEILEEADILKKSNKRLKVHVTNLINKAKASGLEAKIEKYQRWQSNAIRLDTEMLDLLSRIWDAKHYSQAIKQLEATWQESYEEQQDTDGSSE